MLRTKPRRIKKIVTTISFQVLWLTGGSLAETTWLDVLSPRAQGKRSALYKCNYTLIVGRFSPFPSIIFNLHRFNSALRVRNHIIAHCFNYSLIDNWSSLLSSGIIAILSSQALHDGQKSSPTWWQLHVSGPFLEQQATNVFSNISYLTIQHDVKINER